MDVVVAYPEKELISVALSKAQDHQAPVALWRLPHTTQKNLIVADGCQLLEPAELLEERDPGFLMAPFQKNKRRFYLPADRLFTFSGGRLQGNNGLLGERSIEWLTERLASGEKPNRFIVGNTYARTKDTDMPSFARIVDDSVREIERGYFEKVVPSRTRTIDLPTSFDVVECFQKLCDRYPAALISFVNIPGVGAWLGASPEILVSVHDKSVFKTVALAGTIPYSPGIDVRSVSWTQKEIEEQALVGRYIISCFKKIRLREYDEQGPKTVVAGNLMHLKSEYTVDMKATNFPQMGSVMLDLLHPTSAVCGMPLEPALAFLNKVEGYDREFFAGYLGPVNVDNDIHLFVNLRCMRLSGRTATLFAGAGVTIDSQPEKEWDETEMKFDTLLNVIL